MATEAASGHCHQAHHLRTCAFCFFLCIFINPTFVHSADEVRTTLPSNKGLSDNIGKESGETQGTRVSFIKRLFLKYGQNGTMNFEAFEHLLFSLGMVKSVKSESHITDHDLSAHLQNGKFQNIHDDRYHNGVHSNADFSNSHDNRQEAAEAMGDYFGWQENEYDNVDHFDHTANKELSHKGNDGEEDGEVHDDHLSHDHSSHNHDYHNHEMHGNDQQHSDHQVAPVPKDQAGADSGRSKRSYSSCMSARDILQVLNITKDQPISEKDFVKICPILIYQIDGHNCQGNDLSHHHDDHSLHDHGSHGFQGNDTDKGYGSIIVLNAPLIVWGWSLLSVFIISLVGLLGVAIVPVMQKVFYNHLLQFLVALAVGSLTGDAFLHLLPHALLPHDTHDSNGHGGHQGHSKEGTYKGLVAFAGVYFFFLTERIMGLVTEWRRKINRQKNKKVTEAITSPKLLPSLTEQETEMGYKLARGDGSCEERMMMVHPSKDLRNMAEDMHDHIHRDCGKDDNKRISHSHGGAGHNHGHGHIHDVPDSVASVAWMVIMGDGLHNFSDGLAIGAAFANSMSGGLSTSIAVFCHELPHELGDFAMLLRAGMSVRQALVYNCVSSILCLVGMIVGVAAGNIEAVSLWIFALAGGMFIYIALVDMLPEMINNAPKHGENPVWHLILQNVGILMGSGVMLVIALYEDQIKVPDVFP